LNPFTFAFVGVLFANYLNLATPVEQSFDKKQPDIWTGFGQVCASALSVQSLASQAMAHPLRRIGLKNNAIKSK
jgi:hypothetical protein